MPEGCVSELGEVFIGRKRISHDRIGWSHFAKYVSGKEGAIELLLDLIHLEGLINGGDTRLAKVLFGKKVLHDTPIWLDESHPGLVLPHIDEESPKTADGIRSNAMNMLISSLPHLGAPVAQYQRVSLDCLTLGPEGSKS